MGTNTEPTTGAGMHRDGPPARMVIDREPHSAVRLAMGGTGVMVVQPMVLVGLDWSRAQSIGFIILILGLILGCAALLHARRQDRQEADTLRKRHARQVDELVHQQELRIREAVERGAVRERDRADNALKDRLNTVLRTMREGFDQLEKRVDVVEEREHARGSAIGLRMEEAMLDLRRAGKATVRLMLERFGLPSVLEDLRWALEAPGAMRVALHVQGIGPSIDRRDQLGIYHLVHDAVDTALGHGGVDRVAIRVEASAGKCSLSVDSNGGEPLSRHDLSDHGRRRLAQRVAVMNGSLRAEALPDGGRTVHVEIPLGP